MAVQLREDYPLTGPIDLVMDRRSQIKLRQSPTIVICIPVGGKDINRMFETPDGVKWMGQSFLAPAAVPIRWALNHMQLVVPLNTSATYLVRWGVRSAQARQHMTMEALKLNPDYILYWDDDVIVPSLALYTLYNFMQQHPEAGAVTGVYCTRETPTEPLIYKRHGEGAYWNFEAGPAATPEEIFGCGAGFLLTRTETIRKMLELNPEQPLWADEHAVKLGPDETVSTTEANARIMWGHDIRFCRLIQEAGSKVFVNGQVMLGHWDLQTAKLYTLPADSLPYQRGENINTKTYWDDIYSQEGVNTWRRYPEMFQTVAESVPVGSRVFEVGAGVGVLGSMLTAQRQVEYSGCDISQVAVDCARTRYLFCHVAAVKDLQLEDLTGKDTVVATELVEHLEPEDVLHLLGLLRESDVKRFIFSVPDSCMPPEEVPEHRAVYDETLVTEMLVANLPGCQLTFARPDNAHLVVVASGWQPSGSMPKPELVEVTPTTDRLQP